jgi:hypothetical protein
MLMSVMNSWCMIVDGPVSLVWLESGKTLELPDWSLGLG